METNMELVERYLQAVKAALPGKQSDDIVQELRDSILSQVEERESTLGRPLNSSEIAEILKKMGNPMTLASRYGGRRQIIGGSLFTIYWKVLTWALTIALVAHAATSIAIAASGKPFGESLAVFFHFPGVALKVFAIVTLVFAALDLLGARLRPCDHWDPFKLPELVKKPARKSKFDLVVQLVLQAVFSAWWLTGLHYQYLVLGPGANFIRFGPIWLKIYPLFVVAASIDIGLTALALMRPDWGQPARAVRLLKHALGLLLLFLLANPSTLFVPADVNRVEWQPVVRSINFGLHIGLVAAIVATLVNFVRDGVRFVRHLFAHEQQAAMGL
jgi:hypothetical protein